MKVESISSDISHVDNRIKKTIIKTLVDEKTNKEYQVRENYFYEVYDKSGKIRTEETHSVDKKA